ncbi:Uncaracterized surface protein containing fasciclin (FAS1) repeats [Robiginitalea myxolifaciens]|uniref:Uncaracterized surface protein containing fasciclin (FAS1) repeats n=1 Tax=Robiginitalea myxolifaciens TaxID=400055 RepID=A0A1I6FY81_9FLAO|nr:fasciclin domain-containing protein [Robiginitalea myxolifaciens]SFR34898.1 Uncaracterized surface protein containing fasciclin (FAS1) repeats [Robiginitalea myxolifaciens]
MKTRNTAALILALSGFLLLLSCKSDAKQTASESTTATGISKEEGQAFVEDDISAPNILNIAIQSEDHTTLVAAVQAADLENSLVNAGPLMVFAPTNAAFDELPAGSVEDLLKPENKEALANILKYHVTPGNYDREFLKKFKKLGQANDQNVLIEVREDEVYVGGAKIVASIPASNGIIHVVDKVMLPSEE